MSQVQTLHLKQAPWAENFPEGSALGADGDPSPTPLPLQAGRPEAPTSSTSSLPPRVSQPLRFPAPLALGRNCSPGAVGGGVAPWPQPLNAGSLHSVTTTDLTPQHSGGPRAQPGVRWRTPTFPFCAHRHKANASPPTGESPNGHTEKTERETGAMSKQKISF